MGERVLLQDFRIVDGRGGPIAQGDVEVEGETIARVGDFPKRETYREVVEGNGRYLFPGFIDIHSHGDLMNFKKRGLKPKIMQGVTTEVTGQCGLGPAPIDEKRKKGWRRRLFLKDPLEEWPWDSVGSFFHALESHGLESNFIYFLPHGLLRYGIKGSSPSLMSEEEICLMRDKIEESFTQGALGASLGLCYFPAMFSSSKELRALFEEAASYQRPISIHLRSEGRGLLESLQEICNLSKGLSCKLHISHLKVIGEGNASQMDEVFTILKRESMTFDHYPYNYGNLPLSVILPPEVYKKEGLEGLRDPKIREELKEAYSKGGGSFSSSWDNLPYLLGWDKIKISSLKSDRKEFMGSSIEDVAKKLGLSPWDLSFQLLLEEEGEAMIHDVYMREEMVEKILAHEGGSISTDSLFGETMHPRTFFSYPKVLKEHVFKKGILSLPTAIYKMTSWPAQILGLKDRGEVAPGRVADLVIFSPSDLCEEERRTGIQSVMINGRWKVKEGVYLETTPGRILS